MEVATDTETPLSRPKSAHPLLISMDAPLGTQVEDYLRLAIKNIVARGASPPGKSGGGGVGEDSGTAILFPLKCQTRMLVWHLRVTFLLTRNRIQKAKSLQVDL